MENWVFLNVISGPEISIGKYVNGKDSLKVRYYCSNQFILVGLDILTNTWP
jgi:hypothetical protein